MESPPILFVEEKKIFTILPFGFDEEKKLFTSLYSPLRAVAVIL